MTDDRITGVHAAVYRLPTERPEADGTLAWDATTVVVVRARAGCTTGTGWTYASSAAKSVIDDHLVTQAVGRSAFDVPGIWQGCVQACRNLGRPGIVSSSIAAVDIALWDLKARLLGLPLYRLLGRVRDDVPIYGSGGFTTYDDDTLRRQLTGWVEGDGARAVKIKIGESWGRAVARDLARVATTRAHVGDDVEVFVDANGGYTVGQAMRVGQRLADLGVTWFEEPVSSDDVTGLAAVRRQVLPDVAAGEYGYDLPYFERLCAAGAVDCLQIDVTRAGGITDTLRAASVSAAHSIEVSTHTAPHVSAHVGAAIPNVRHLEHFWDHVRVESALFDGVLKAHDGVLSPDPSAPGLGVELREADADAFRIA